MLRAVVVLALVLACLGSVARASDGPSIYAVNYPLAYFAERIAGDAADVVLPIPNGRDAALWKPSIAVIGAFQQADLILLNGGGFAAWTTKASLPRSRMVDTSRAFADRYITTESVTHSHGPEGEHSHTGTASFTWLDFEQAAQQAEAVTAALTRQFPEHAAVFADRLAALRSDLEALNAAARSLGAAGDSAVLIASHPRYQYFARAYGFRIESLEWEAGDTPSEAQLADLDALLAVHPARILLWEGPPTDEAKRAVAARGLTSVVFSPAAGPQPDGDFLTVMAANLKALGEALRQPQDMGSNP